MIHNISIATVYDVIILSDDVNIYPVDLIKEIDTLNTVSVSLKIRSFQVMICFTCFSFWELIYGHCICGAAILVIWPGQFEHIFVFLHPWRLYMELSYNWPSGV